METNESSREGARLSYEDLMGKLETSGFLDVYRERCKELLPSLFEDPYGIHGIAHAKRVLMLSLILSHLHDLDREDTDILVVAALFHDIGRIHNGKCCVHGKDSYNKMARLELLPEMGADGLRLLRYVIENHCVNDRDGLKNVDDYDFDKDRAIKLLKLFKDCDNLDRVRLGDLNVKYLRNRYSPRLVTVAEKLLREIT